MNCLRAAFVLLLLAPPISPSLAADQLAMLRGEWSGTGWAKRTTDGPRETVRCRVSSKYSPPARRLLVTGKCAVPGRKFNLRGVVSSEVDGGAIRGSWANPFGAGSASVSGSQSGNRVTLDFRAPHPDTKEDVPQQMEWTIGDRAFSITTKLGDGEVMSELKFGR